MAGASAVGTPSASDTIASIILGGSLMHRHRPWTVALLLVAALACADGGGGSGDSTDGGGELPEGSDANGPADASVTDAGLPDGATVPDGGAPAGLTYYLSCDGDDSAEGTSPSSAWKSLAKANTAPLQPGDSLLLARGCSFAGKLNAAWNGTANLPIRIGAYGMGENPVVLNDVQGTTKSFVGIVVAGSYQIVEDLRVTVTNPYREPTCVQSDGSGVPLGWYVGFQVSGHHDVLRRVEAYGLALGIHLTDASAFDQVLESSFHDLKALWRLDESAGAMGAMGINLHGDDHEIAWNRFERNFAACTLPTGTAQHYSAPFEVYNANRNLVHHNQAFGHRKHFEMGHDATHTTQDNVFAYNLLVSDVPNAVGPNIHGSGNPYGPVDRTSIHHNTVVFTGANSQGITCSCSGGALVTNNVFVAEWKSAYYSGNVVEGANLYWDLGGTTDTQSDPFVQFASGSAQTSPSPTSKLASPSFVLATVPGGDFHLGAASPALDVGASIAATEPRLSRALSEDLDGRSVPQASGRDLGAYEAPSFE